MNFLRISTPKEEGELRVSKWLKFQVLLDPSEMRSLFTELGEFYLFNTSQPVTEDTAEVSKDRFLGVYQDYGDNLKKGLWDNSSEYRLCMSSALTCNKDALYAMQLPKDRFLIKTIKPVIQLQQHQFFISSIDHTFHPMVLGASSISWGFQISYPQLYQDPKTQLVEKVGSDFANSALFTKIIKWLRANTAPTPFLYRGQKTYVPIRLGRTCLNWINEHPQLKSNSVQVISKNEVL